MTNYMDKALREAKEKWLEEQTLDRYYKKMHFNNLVSRATFMEEKGIHMNETITQVREIASQMKGLTPESRHRMSKEIAEELLAEHGATAHLYCLEKLANDTSAPRLWRDVLSYLDEIGVTDGAVETDRDGRGEEQASHPTDDSENSNP